ncbi:Tripartite-type tricarboxylate transporter, receptor component TctC [Enhydrobacter aerosaccus]|uniref:Tripartite-type tricarboxylate transporter, receptor component TctC n=1 Tax=Enhydrobacter aerosaccus TaxID=225324 RepID=A0A1T4K9K0_9HYPH|nr:tripartite tricarboxylate transporter substrate binding protein [Enhydrobacter aerosaccus]SJZ39128.1 Tripartite-type tricarboxylate transporter, receptor component TctC [Enhydrobacter aerosaccus]
MTRFSTVLSGIAAVVALVLGVAAQAQSAYPNRPITLVVPYPPGGSADILARTVGAELGKRLGQPVVIDNRGGAGTAIGTKVVASAAPDGYTLLLGTVSSQAINPAMNKVAYDPLKDFTAVSPLASIPFVLAVNPAAKIDSVAALIAQAKAQPDGLSYASAGPGTSNHLAGELLASEAHIRLLHVPYKGSAPALNDVIAGVVPMMFDLQTTTLPYLKSGKLKALAVTSKTRSSLLPDVPTMIESGLPGYEVTAWFGVFAPAGLPAPILARLNTDITDILKTPEMTARLRELGAELESGDPVTYAAYARSESVKWADVIKRYGLAP